MQSLYRKFLVTISGVILLVGILMPLSAQAVQADWTIMVYMNGKNDLEPAAIQNFLEMAQVGSTDRVNVIVNLGRPTTGEERDTRYGGWSGVARYRVTKGLTPTRESAMMFLASSSEEADMGSPKALEGFIAWTMQRYPAGKYMLVIWNHGRGYRFLHAPLTESTAKDRAESSWNQKSGERGGYKSVSYDQDTKHTLYNSDIAAVLNGHFGDKRKLDLLGFDACLMGMIETAYAFRKSTSLMVASEDLIPNRGWQYEPVLEALTKTPTLSAEDVGFRTIEAYKAFYSSQLPTTLSLLDVSRSASVAQSVSDLSSALLKDQSKYHAAVQVAREPLTTYGLYYQATLTFSIDLKAFLKRLRSGVADTAVQRLIDQTSVAVDAMVIKNYASADRSTPQYDSSGLAIFFPKTETDFYADGESGGYLKSNDDHPIEFVTDNQWPNFLASYLGLQDAQRPATVGAH